MPVLKPKVDKVRASRDGHEFHEIWAARKALTLVAPDTRLAGIAIEGLSTLEAKKMSSNTIEIADVTLYYGQNTNFNDADSITIAQLKYSIGEATLPFRSSHAKKTIQKFAKSYQEHIKKFGHSDVISKLSFELITNRPIYGPFEDALNGIINNNKLVGEAQKQAKQFKTACNLSDKQLIEFASKFRLTGLVSSLPESKVHLLQTVVDWSGSKDARSIVRLQNLKDLVRNKAGHAGSKNNVITIIDILATLELKDEKDLFPCPELFPSVPIIIKRQQVREVVEQIPELKKPLLIHANGGIGKTVFMQTLAEELSPENHVILFDCFGGGAYRDPAQARHLPKLGLVHIANLLASRGLCDLVLPGCNDTEELLQTFRRRLEQSLSTLRRASDNANLIILIDAIDNAAEFAKENNDLSFPTLLLRSLQFGEPIEGLKVIVSCRSHRIEVSKGEVECQEFHLKEFTFSETKSYLESYVNDVSETEIRVAYSRSRGNPRVLKHLVKNRSMLGQSEIDRPITLDELIADSIESALKEAKKQGYSQIQLDSFLAGLAILPPPVPLDEYADANGMSLEAVQSFAADIASILEHTKYGIMFSDEPTETYIRENYRSSPDALKVVTNNLFQKQDKSVYAARSLPDLLQRLGKEEDLYKLAYETRFPDTSTVGKRNIRLARIKAAVRHATNKKDFNNLTKLLVELSSIAASDNRGIELIFDYPDLVIAAKDTDAIRKLFETQTNWPGTRHAVLTIANTLLGDFEDANWHAIRALEWIAHYYNNITEDERDRPSPEVLDICSIPLYYLASNSPEDALKFLRSWKNGYSYLVTKALFSFLQQIINDSPVAQTALNVFLELLTNELGIIVSTLCYLELDQSVSHELVKKLSKACQSKKKLSFREYRPEHKVILQDGVFKAAVLANSYGLNKEASVIFELLEFERPRLSSFRSHSSHDYIYPFIINIAFSSILNKSEVNEVDLLPDELFNLLMESECDKDIKSLNKLIESVSQPGKGKVQKTNTFQYEDKYDSGQFLTNQLPGLLKITQLFSRLISCSTNEVESVFTDFIEVWSQYKKKQYLSYSSQERFFSLLGQRLIFFTLWIRQDLSSHSIERIFEIVLAEPSILYPTFLIEIIEFLVRRSDLHSILGKEAVKVSDFIKKDDDVSFQATLLSKLGKALLPISKDEAAVYFKIGLEQMEAIGSSDYNFTNELLMFAASLKGNELNEKDTHTLTNICELNMAYEEEKFPWASFASAMSKTTGMKGLAKISRWDDREKISLEYTLLPYLTALLLDEKINPDYAVALLQLAEPVGLWACNTEHFCKALEKNPKTSRSTILKLVQNTLADNRLHTNARKLDELATLTRKYLEETSEINLYLEDALEVYQNVNEESNTNKTFPAKLKPGAFENLKEYEDPEEDFLLNQFESINPKDEIAVIKHITQILSYKHRHDLLIKFLESLKNRVDYANRSDYILMLASLESVDLYVKLNQLESCKEDWLSSSLSIQDALECTANTILQSHTIEFVTDEHFSVHLLTRLSELTNIPIVTLALNIITIFLNSDIQIASSVWMCIAGIICEHSDPGEGQEALSRLLNSESAKLASSVLDGPWRMNLYPPNDEDIISAGLIWRMLGSPRAIDRWRAAHVVRNFADFGNWKVINILFSHFNDINAGPFQAAELPFYFLHARLWLLIALARIALDTTSELIQFCETLRDNILHDSSPHLLIQYFASQILLNCYKDGNLSLTTDEFAKFTSLLDSPFPIKKRTARVNYHQISQAYEQESDEAEIFHLDYNFDKYRLGPLCDVFGITYSDARKKITSIVRKYDSNIGSMYENIRRPAKYDSHDSSYSSSKYDAYGQQLGWHAFYILAAELLSTTPIIEDYSGESPWPEFLENSLLTQKDGYWLSDGIDNRPLHTVMNLLERGEENLELTGNQEKLLRLVNIDTAICDDIVVYGSWYSTDHINVHISSSLIEAKDSMRLIPELLKEEPFRVWIPAYYGSESSYSVNNKPGYQPWIVCPSIEPSIDEQDPLGSISALKRPYFTKQITTDFKMNGENTFLKYWTDDSKKVLALSSAWGDNNKPQYSLSCKKDFLTDVLKTKDLIILVKIERYEEGRSSIPSKFHNSIAVIHIDSNLNHTFYQGAVNFPLKSEF